MAVKTDKTDNNTEIELVVKIPGALAELKGLCEGLGIDFGRYFVVEACNAILSDLRDRGVDSNLDDLIWASTIGKIADSVCAGIEDYLDGSDPGEQEVQQRVVIKVPKALYARYAKFCEVHEHKLPADLIEQTTIDSMRNSMDASDQESN